MTNPAAAEPDSRTVTCSFEVTEWDDQLYLETPDGPAMAQVAVRKTFSGAVEGSSTARVLTAGGPGGRGYVASERFEGTFEGRAGSFMMQHGGIGADGEDAFSFGSIVPGGGTGELAGLRGRVRFQHDDQGAVITFTITSGWVSPAR